MEGHADSVLNLEQRKLRLETALKERKAEIVQHDNKLVQLGFKFEYFVGKILQKSSLISDRKFSQNNLENTYIRNLNPEIRSLNMLAK